MLISRRLPIAAEVAITADKTFGPFFLGGFRGVSLQLITEDQVDEVTVEAGDEAVNATDTLTLAGYDFTGKEGAIIRISGSEDNDGDHVVTTGADGSAVCSASTLVDEEFDPNEVTIVVLRADDPLVGDWVIEVSNDYTDGLDGTPNDGHWSDVTDWFSPPLDTVTGPSDQPVQTDPLDFDAFRISFNYTSGIGTVSIPANQKGQ